MIKLIATDMDGTLLNEKGQIPENFPYILERLEEKNVKFVVASGRPYFTLYENFAPVSDKLYYICDNGAFIVEKGKIISISVMDKFKVNEMIRCIESIPNTEIILCGKNGAYHKPCNKEFSSEIDKYYVKKYVVEDLTTVDDEIFKIAICCLESSSITSYNILNSNFSEEFMIVVSGEAWVDIMNKNVNKGEALRKIQESESFSYNETMVFGDFYNDIEMLKNAHYSFVMENANEDMKQYGNFIAPKNTENGVIGTIEKYIFNS
ncbi:Cof-type HAD-IIB family hydrolase [Clostridium sp. SHJSY1]|uniref:HAD family hydrolase n=1 Tax=Clostridium sp. SHJSY1 TaxID=2942483 RepID=UPI002875FE15|nr:HAD family hydrolase [Clostridium sp. SHJSY1]MDS0528520.1 Cof-type HAD-IIB family hydrolase [Clostridium sp. SHJSY1]